MTALLEDRQLSLQVDLAAVVGLGSAVALMVQMQEDLVVDQSPL